MIDELKKAEKAVLTAAQKYVKDRKPEDAEALAEAVKHREEVEMVSLKELMVLTGGAIIGACCILGLALRRTK